MQAVGPGVAQVAGADAGDERVRGRRSRSSTTSARKPFRYTLTPHLDGAVPALAEFMLQTHQRLLPDVLGRDGARAAHARHPGAGRGRVHAGQAAGLGHLHRERPRRPRLGRGVLPRLRLDAVRADAGQPPADGHVVVEPEVREASRPAAASSKQVQRLPDGAHRRQGQVAPTGTPRARTLDRVGSQGRRGRQPEQRDRHAAAAAPHGRFITWLFTVSLVVLAAVLVLKAVERALALPAPRPARAGGGRLPRPGHVRRRPGPRAAARGHVRGAGRARSRRRSASTPRRSRAAPRSPATRRCRWPSARAGGCAASCGRSSATCASG